MNFGDDDFRAVALEVENAQLRDRIRELEREEVKNMDDLMRATALAVRRGDRVRVRRDDNGTVVEVVLGPGYDAGWDRVFTDAEVEAFRRDPWALWRRPATEETERP